MCFNRVVLPHPLPPTTKKISLRLTLKEMFSVTTKLL